ncbi:MAG: DUF1549 and DUF1553 domain-containing protein [Pirellulaceae bacterium]
MRYQWILTLTLLHAITASAAITAEPRTEVKPPLYERFAPDGEKVGTDEVPDFQQHVSPLLGRLGCNGRACHGSFQGQGGFQLSLFGYDFKADHAALLEEGADRIDLSDKLESLILTKPVDANEHEGGKRFERGGWEYWVLRSWIEAGAPYSTKQLKKLDRVEVTPNELQFTAAGQQVQLRAIARWADGTAEDVTCLCRFQSNDTSIAEIDESGLVTCGDPGDTHVVVSYDNAVVPILALRPTSNLIGDRYPTIAANTKIDELVAEKLKKLAIVPSELCTDEEFLRRASLDVTGTLPTTEEVLAFTADNAANKRSKKIDELLERPGYAAQWTTFLCDMTGNNDDQLRNFLPQAVRPENQWYQWIYKRVADNTPYDQVVEGIVTANSRLPDETYSEYCAAMSEICRDSSGEQFADRPGLVHYWARNNFRTAEERAIGFAYSFLGVRIQCAQCHKHPFDQWSKDDFDNFEKLFAAVQANQGTLAPDAKDTFTSMVSDLGVAKSLKGNELRKQLGEKLKAGEVIPFPELVVRAAPANRNKKAKGKAAQPVAAQAKLLGGEWIDMDAADARGKLMDWLRDPSNPYFAKAIVNRVWTQYFSVGIVNPADDLNLANAPSNAPLLDYLATGFIDHGYDLKWLHREILTSDTYQRSWIPNETNKLDRRNFSHALLRRLPAESAYDAVRVAVVNDATVAKAMELDVPRAITQPGASARANNRDDQSYALSVFGRSVRESNCDCDRSSEPSLLQTVFLANDSAVQSWISDPKISWVGQVADKYGWEKSANVTPAAERAQAANLDRLMTSFQQRAERVDTRLADAKAKGQKQLVETLQKQKAEMLKQARAAAKKNGLDEDGLRKLVGRIRSGDAAEPEATPSKQASVPNSSAGINDEQAMWIAEQAYLRTLSRKPSSSELSTAVQFLKSEEKPTVAVEGLVWSLINTKEFILNH